MLLFGTLSFHPFVLFNEPVGRMELLRHVEAEGVDFFGLVVFLILLPFMIKVFLLDHFTIMRGYLVHARDGLAWQTGDHSEACVEARLVVMVMTVMMVLLMLVSMVLFPRVL